MVTKDELEAATRRWQARAAKYDPAPGRDHEEGETMKPMAKPSGLVAAPMVPAGDDAFWEEIWRRRGPAGPVLHIRGCER